MSTSLDRLLTPLSDAERRQLATNSSYNRLNLDYLHDPVPEMPLADFFDHGDIAVTKNPRFAVVPAHTHAFVELNYQYRGTTTHLINGEKITLHPHNLLMLDKAIVQQLDYTDESDLLVDILIKDGPVVSRLADIIPITTNIVTEFLYNANYLSNKLRASTGRSFKELVDRRRLAVAQNLMIKTSLSLDAICEQLGYQNSSSLYRLFMKYLQISPSIYQHNVTQRGAVL